MYHSVAFLEEWAELLQYIFKKADDIAHKTVKDKQ